MKLENDRNKPNSFPRKRQEKGMPTLNKLTWTEHQRKWKNCTRCELHKTRSNMVRPKGKLPCEVLFVGEVPGMSEDAIGKVFIGPSGDLLEHIIQVAERKVDQSYLKAYTKLLACIPLDEEGNTIKPKKEYLQPCSVRLSEFITLANPKLIVCVGSLAEKQLKNLDVPMITLTHPYAILNADVSQKELTIQRNIVQLMEALHHLKKRI